jgi:hydrogenase expression/formation protein HypC
MCIALPMQVLDPALGLGVALCGYDGEVRAIRTSLIGTVSMGDHVLVHVDTAIRKLDADEAQLIANALKGLALAERGDAFEHLFADLDREPQLPPHLRGQAA